MREFYFAAFSCKCKIKINSNNDEALVKECFKTCERLHKKYNFFDPNSYLSKINTRTSNKIKIDEESANILKDVYKLSQECDFYFDIARAVSNTDELDLWNIDKRWLYFKNQNIKLNLGGVIKEYAAKECARICKNSQFIINFSGDIICNTPVNLMIKNPKNPTKALCKINYIGAVCTSGQYERNNHIKTFAKTNINQASVFSDDILKAGVLSTAYCAGFNKEPKKAILVDFNNDIKSFGFLDDEIIFLND